MEKKPEIFLSYAREDRPIVEHIYHTLRAEGFSPWMDTRDIQAGMKWSSVRLSAGRTQTDGEGDDEGGLPTGLEARDLAAEETKRVARA